MEHLLVYNPEPEVTDRVLDNGDLVSKWETETGVDEFLFELDNTIYNNREFEEWLENKVATEYRNTIVSPSRPDKARKIVGKNVSLRDRLLLEDVSDEREVCQVLRNEGLDGDIRKYINHNYLGSSFSIGFKTRGTNRVTITSMNPISMDGVRELLTLGVAEDIVPEKVSNQPHYPSPRRILRWARIVNEDWDDVECAAIGNIHFKTENINAGFDGFVIYDADEEVKEWCDERWFAVDSWSEREELEFPFMYPSEYDLRTDEEEWLDRSRIRMWWD